MLPAGHGRVGRAGGRQRGAAGGQAAAACVNTAPSDLRRAAACMAPGGRPSGYPPSALAKHRAPSARRLARLNTGIARRGAAGAAGQKAIRAVLARLIGPLCALRR